MLPQPYPPILKLKPTSNDSPKSPIQIQIMNLTKRSKSKKEIRKGKPNKCSMREERRKKAREGNATHKRYISILAI